MQPDDVAALRAAIADVDARIDRFAESVAARLDPVIRRAVDEVMGERTTVHTVIETDRAPVFAAPLPDLNAFMDERGIAAPIRVEWSHG